METGLPVVTAVLAHKGFQRGYERFQYLFEQKMRQAAMAASTCTDNKQFALDTNARQLVFTIEMSDFESLQAMFGKSKS